MKSINIVMLRRSQKVGNPDSYRDSKVRESRKVLLNEKQGNLLRQAGIQEFMFISFRQYLF
jgi:hypothetical protein